MLGQRRVASLLEIIVLFLKKKKNKPTKTKPNQKKQMDILMDWTEERIPELSGMSSGLANSRWKRLSLCLRAPYWILWEYSLS